jgi:beta-glucosidase
MTLRTVPAVLFAAAVLVPRVPAQMAPPPKRETRAWMLHKNLSPDQRADLVIAQMTLDEKIQLVHGAGMAGIGPVDESLVRSNGGGGFVPGIERLGLPDLNMDDSSVGVGGGAHKGRYATALPSTLALASSWDKKLALEYGTLIGRELANQGYNVSLAGGVDVTREPRNGRNFEYEGEDPILAGNMVAGLINGIQSQGIIGDIKHYAMNDEETGRYFENILADKRSMRETDLLAFEIGIREAHPGMVMCSYNLLNGTYACENDYLLNQVLKRDWGFKGWVISDWFATHSTVAAANAGLDQQQPGSSFFGEPLKKAVQGGQVPLARLNDMVHRIVRTEFASGVIDRPQTTQVPDVFHGLQVAQHVEESSAVLLRNGHSQLPLSASALKLIAVIGSHADVGVLSGGGSAQVDPEGGNAVPSDAKPGDILTLFTTQVWHRSSPLNAIQSLAPNAQIAFEPGGDIESAAAKAKISDVAIVFVSQHTHEGNDLNTLALQGNQNELVEAVAAANPHTIVVVESGGAVAMPWANKVSAIVEAWYPGIRGAEAIAGILFGKVNPSGKLAVTFPMSDADLPRPKLPAPASGIPSPLDGIMNVQPPFDIHYGEGLKVGYKWYEAEGKKPLYAFGHGLSYTSYEFSGMQAKGGTGLSVSFAVQNTGKVAGQETAQVYLTFPQAAAEPAQRLVGWEKIALEPGETKTLSIAVDPLYLSVFNVQANKWEVVPGEYEVRAGPASDDLPLRATVKLDKK